jgi:hypothetical protein
MRLALPIIGISGPEGQVLTPRSKNLKTGIRTRSQSLAIRIFALEMKFYKGKLFTSNSPRTLALLPGIPLLVGTRSTASPIFLLLGSLCHLA